MRTRFLLPSQRRRALYGGISPAVAVVAAYAAIALHCAHADRRSDGLFPGVSVIAPHGKQASTIAADEAQCASAALGNIDKYATCLEDLQYVLPGSVNKSAAVPAQLATQPASTPLPPDGLSSTQRPSASNSQTISPGPTPEAGRTNYEEITKITAAGDAEFRAGHYVAALRVYVIIDGMDSAISANASQFGFDAGTPPSDAAPGRKQAYEELQDLVTAQRNLGLMYERGLGDDQSYMMAAGWYDRALSHGLSDAQAEEHLGVLLGNGLGVAQNTRRAAQLLEHSRNEDLVVLLRHNKLPRTFDAGANPAVAALAASLRAQDAAEVGAKGK